MPVADEYEGWFCDVSTRRVDIYVHDLLGTEHDLEADRAVWRHTVDELRRALQHPLTDGRARIREETAKTLVNLIELGMRGDLPVSWAAELPTFTLERAVYAKTSLPPSRRARPQTGARQLRFVVYAVVARRYGLDPDPEALAWRALNVEPRRWRQIARDLAAEAETFFERLVWTVAPGRDVKRFVESLATDPESARDALRKILRVTS